MQIYKFTETRKINIFNPKQRKIYYLRKNVGG